MTRQLSVSQLKGNSYQHFDGKPSEGSTLRMIYDALRMGLTVSVKQFGGGRLRQLVDMYGMELETVRAEPKDHCGKGVIIGMRLVGEWEGPYYVPAERIIRSDEV